MSGKRLLVLVLSILLVTTSCSSGQITRTRGDVRIWLHDSDLFAGGEDAIVFGTMAYDRSIECMFLEAGDALLPVIWPAGTRIESEDPVVLSVPGGTVTEGDGVTGGGGYAPPDRYRDLIPDVCRSGATEIAVFNADSRIDVDQP